MVGFSLRNELLGTDSIIHSLTVHLRLLSRKSTKYYGVTAGAVSVRD